MPTPLPPLSTSLAEALSDLQSAYEVAGRSPHTTALFTHYIGRLVEFLDDAGVRDVEQVQTVHLTRFLASEKARGLKPASLSVVLRTMRRFFAWCVEQGSISTNPAKSVMPPSVTIEPVTFLNDDQLAALLGNIARDRTVEGLRDTALVRVLMDSGLRRGEVMGLTVGSVDLEARTIVVSAASSKMRRGRVVPVSQTTAAALKTYLRVRAAYLARAGRQDDGALWISARGALSPNGALQALRRRLKAAGLPKVTLHSLRHGWAARATEDGLPMAFLMATGGWTSPAMPTMRYGKFGVEGRAIEAMQALLDR